jgi:Uma2 family endonuclease
VLVRFVEYERNQARQMGMTATQLVTADELLAMGSDAPYELIEGVLKEVSPSSSKSSVIGIRISSAIFNFVDAQGLGYVTGEGGGYILSHSPATVVVPDVGFYRKDRYPGGVPESGFYPMPPDMAVEVISPSDRKADIAQKQALYAKAGVPLVWWVDPERKMVTGYRLGQAPEVVDGDGVLSGGDVLPGFELTLRSVFRD